jgi:hypothetical protein
MCSSAAVQRAPGVVREIERHPVTTIRLAISVARLSLTALLIASAQPGRPGETTATSISVQRQAPDVDRMDAAAEPSPAQPAHAVLPQFLGVVGFGWG